MEHVAERSLVDEVRKDEIRANLKRLEQQVRETTDLVGMDQCDSDVMMQLSVIIASARRVGLLVLQEHIRRSLAAAGCQPESVLKDIDETIERFTSAAYRPSSAHRSSDMAHRLDKIS